MTQPTSVTVTFGDIRLQGLLRTPPDARGIVLFAHGSGSGRLSPRNNYVAEQLGKSGLATLLFDLLTAEEEQIDEQTAALRFDIPLLTERLVAATEWTRRQPALRHFPVGYFGASTGAAAALMAAAQVPDIAAVVSRGGRPDLAGAALPEVRAATLLIVGGDDHQVIVLNRQARDQMTCEVKLEIVPGATHLFVEPGTLEQVAALAAGWFAAHMGTQG
jgi:dienelactone hydrolase